MTDATSEAQFVSIYKEAIAKYEQENGTEGLSAVPCDIDGLLKEMTTRLSKFSAFRKKDKSIRQALKPLVEIVNTFAEVACEGVSLAPVSLVQSLYTAVSLPLRVTNRR